jgi:hypothetical protein
MTMTIRRWCLIWTTSPTKLLQVGSLSIAISAITRSHGL